MAKYAYYAVALTNGRKEIVSSWDEAKAIIATCPSNARYKGFGDVDSARRFLFPEDTPWEAKPDSVAFAYVDGSYNPATGIWGYGVHLEANGKAYEFYDCGRIYADARNVAGEVYGCLRALREAVALNISAITIYYDYAGIEMWATGAWKTEKPLTKEYAKTIAKLRKHIDIEFCKVAAHTGVKLNERVDMLAKQAVGLV